MRAIALAVVVTLCSCSHGHELTGKDAEPPGRYRAYLKGLGVNPNGGVIEHPSMTAGPFRFFSSGSRDEGRNRAAASNKGLVAGHLRPGDDWHDFIAAGAPKVIAERIAWLENEPGPGPNDPGKGLKLLDPHDQLSVPIDPASWIQVTKPTRQGDVFTAWYLPKGGTDPVRWQITAPAGKKAVIDQTPATKLKPMPPPEGRAPAALVSPNLHERLWGLKVLQKTPDVHAVVPVGQLVEADPEPLVREQAAIALGIAADERGVEPLRRAFVAEPDEARRKIYLDALARIPGDKASAALGQLAGLKPPKPKKPKGPQPTVPVPPPPPPPPVPVSLRLDAVRALAARPDPTAIAALKNLAAHADDESVRAMAASPPKTN